jgi:hypothetical protein
MKYEFEALQKQIFIFGGWGWGEGGPKYCTRYLLSIFAVSRESEKFWKPHYSDQR